MTERRVERRWWRAGRALGFVAGAALAAAGAGEAGAESPDDSKVVAGLSLAPARGLYEGSLRVAITTPTSGAAIYYTLDGRAATSRSGTRYSGPFEVQGTAGRAVVTVRAAAFRDGYEPSEEAVHSYVFLEQVPSQPSDPKGFPSSWGPAPAVDYGMDPEIVQSRAYGDLIRESLAALPSISLACAVSDVFGPDGIYSNSLEHGEEWERPASAELLYPDGREGFQVRCGLRIYGGASRQPEKSPKHSLRLLFKDDYGPARLKFPLFPGSPVQSFDTLVLRGGYNNTWLHQHGSQRPRGQYVRDQFARDVFREMGQVSAHGIFVHLYVCGLYWGLYNLVERPSGAFGASYFGGEKEDYDAINSGEAVDGDRRAWDAMMEIAEDGVATASAYAALQAYLDVTNLADYMILNLYGGNRDWPGHNWYALRRREAGAQFRFFSWDAERTLEGVEVNQTAVDAEDTPAFLYDRLRENAEFRVLFGDRVHRHLKNGGALTPEAAAARWRSLTDGIALAVVAESARWGDYRRDVHVYQEGPYELYTRNDHWARERARLLETYFPGRTRQVLEQLRAAGLYPGVDAPAFSPEGGEVDPGSALGMTHRTSDGRIYFTTNGADPRVAGSGAVATSAKTYSGPVTLEETMRVKARVLDGRSWSALNEALFVVAPSTDGLVVSEIMYNAPQGKDLDFIELENRGTETADLSGMAFTEGIGYAFPAGTILRPGQHLVLVSSPSAFAARYPGVAASGVYAGSLDNSGEALALSDASGAAVMRIEYDDEDAWPLGPDGLGFSLVRGTPPGDPSRPASWRASARPGGSPGAGDPAPPAGGVVVSEVLANAAPPLEEAIELHNPTAQDIAIGGWWLSDSREDAASLKRYRIPAGRVIGAGGYAVFYAYQFGAGTSGFGLDSQGDGVYVASADASGELTGHVAGRELDGAESGVSYGLHRTSAGDDFTALASRTFGQDSPATVDEFRRGTGAPNAAPRVGPVVFSEVHYHPASGGEQFVELQNLTSEEIALFDEKLQQGWRLHGVLEADGTGDFELPRGAAIPPEGRLLLVAAAPEDFRRRHGVPDATPIAGPFGGTLDNGGERLKLMKPFLAPEGGLAFAALDEVRYDDAAPWPVEPDGAGPSLEKAALGAYSNEPLSWRASRSAGGTPGAPNSVQLGGPNALPEPRFTASPESGAAPLAVLFDAAASTDPDGTIASFAWSFGDGWRATGPQVTHVFAGPGRYVVVLEVTDDAGGAAGASRTISVADPPPAGGSGDGGEPPGPGDGGDGGLPDIARSFEGLRHFVPRSLPAVVEPPPGTRRAVSLPGTAWLLEGKLKGRLKGLPRVVSPERFILLCGPLRVLDDEARTLLELAEGELLLVDGGDRGFSGTYAWTPKGKLLPSPPAAEVQEFLRDFIEARLFEGLEDPSAVGLRRVRLSGKARAKKTGDALKLKLSISFTAPSAAGGSASILKGTYRFSGAGAPLR
ncbi:MAG: lamin tail domain-containing protein [Planctomycetes bacterium]|nr:lamin tail domain-containing protein [Planctomycetota bacterium]